MCSPRSYYPRTVALIKCPLIVKQASRQRLPYYTQLLTAKKASVFQLAVQNDTGQLSKLILASHKCIPF